MGTLHSLTAPPPSLDVIGDRSPVANAYFAISIDAALDLRTAPDYRDLSRAARLARVHAEQQVFLDGLLDPTLNAAFDLRLAADPRSSTPVSLAVLGRVWGDDPARLAARAEGLRDRVYATLPGHVAATPVEDRATVARLLAPLPGGVIDSAVITRHEFIAAPSRPDAGVAYYYSATPFNWSDSDWSDVFSALTASSVPVVVSVAVMPMAVPTSFAQMLQSLTSFYRRLAREGGHDGGPYYGAQRIGPDAFAVDASETFHAYSRRLSQKAFALRIQVSAAKRLPPGLVETIAGAISPASATRRSDGHPERQWAAAPGYAVRRPASVAEQRLAEYNLHVVNFGMLAGRQEIWGRSDPPDSRLAMLTVLGDARDACCAFRFPVALDGVIPGFPVRHDPPSLAETDQTVGQAVGQAVLMTGEKVLRLGTASGETAAPGAAREVTVPLRALAGLTLITGSAGSGKTRTALVIARQLWTDHQIPFLVIDPTTPCDYRELAGEPGLESLEVITAGDEAGAPLRLNPFEVPAGMRASEHSAHLLACLTAAFALSGPLPAIYRDALDLTYLRAGVLLADRADGGERGWPTVADFLVAIREVTEGRGYPGDVLAGIDAASVLRVLHLVRGPSGSVLLTDRRGDVRRLLDHPVIVELGALEAGDEQALIMALLLNAVSGQQRQAGTTGHGLAHVTIVEEPRRLLGSAAPSPAAGGPSEGGPATGGRARETAAGALVNDLASGRRYGAGVMLVERFPARLVPDAVKNARLTVVHRLTADDDRRCLSEAAGMDAPRRGFAAGLRTGEALVQCDEPGAAARVAVASPPRPAGPAPYPVRSAIAPPFAACDQCRAQCAYRGAALSMLNDPAIVTGVAVAAEALAAEALAAEALAAEALARTDDPPERRSVLTELRGRLRGAVSRFAALPADPGGRDDAAYCLLLHIYASGALPAGVAWPAIAADMLGVTGSNAGQERADEPRDG